MTLLHSQDYSRLVMKGCIQFCGSHQRAMSGVASVHGLMSAHPLQNFLLDGLEQLYPWQQVY